MTEQKSEETDQEENTENRAIEFIGKVGKETDCANPAEQSNQENNVHSPRAITKCVSLRNELIAGQTCSFHRVDS
jgi:hypothetical protein